MNVTTFEAEGLFLSLYQFAMCKTVSDVIGKLSIEDSLNFNVYYSEYTNITLLFEKLINEIAEISYYFVGIDDVRNELETTPLFPEVMEEEWYFLYFIPCDSKQTYLQLELDYGDSFHRYSKGKQFKATVQNVGIYLGMTIDAELGNYLDQLKFLIKNLIECGELYG